MNDEKRSWICIVECTVRKEVITDDCTEELAKADPFMVSNEEREIGMSDWSVVSVEPNV